MEQAVSVPSLSPAGGRRASPSPRQLFGLAKESSVPELVKVLFQFEDTPAARRTLALALEDLAWEDHRKHPTLEIGFGMVEHHALFVLTQISQQYGAKLLVVSAEKPVERPAPVKKPTPVRKEEK